MEQLTRERFDAVMGATRGPWTLVTGVEKEWYSEQAEKVLGVIVQDTSDKDFVCIVLGRDRIGRYRAVDLSKFFERIDDARAELEVLLPSWAVRDPRECEQGDEPRQQMDFFTPRHAAERLNPNFAKLVQDEAYSPANGIVEAMMFYFQDPDGNFVEQFQSTAFNPRLWELYLFHVLAEERCEIDRAYPVPDYLFTGIGGEAFIEAVTVNPSGTQQETGYPTDSAELERYLQHYLPIKFAGPLTTKLNRRYWELPHIGERPVVLAVADFHYPQSMAKSQNSLMSYLYGRWFSVRVDERGRRTFESQPIAEHVLGTKTVPSGFFSLPDSQNISAVISIGEELMDKFNRMGLRAGFGSRHVQMKVKGKRYVQDPRLGGPEDFDLDVLSRDYIESWLDGLHVYHNPNATRKLDFRLFAGATHWLLQNGEVGTITVENAPFSIDTTVTVLQPAGEEAQERSGI